MTAPERLRHFGLSVDYRNPSQWALPWPDFFAEMGELAELAEQLGYDYLWLPEHHFSDDGYAPAPLVLASALSQRTSRVRLAMAVAVLPLYHPVRMAEDCAMVDILSKGRFEPGFAVGWREEEFAAFGSDIHERAATTDEALEVMNRLWSGEPVTLHGRRFRLDGVQLMPPPVQRPRRGPGSGATDGRPCAEPPASATGSWAPISSPRPTRSIGTSSPPPDATRTRPGWPADCSGSWCRMTQNGRFIWRRPTSSTGMPTMRRGTPRLPR